MFCLNQLSPHYFLHSQFKNKTNYLHRRKFKMFCFLSLYLALFLFLFRFFLFLLLSWHSLQFWTYHCKEELCIFRGTFSAITYCAHNKLIWWIGIPICIDPRVFFSFTESESISIGDIYNHVNNLMMMNVNINPCSFKIIEKSKSNILK